MKFYSAQTLNAWENAKKRGYLTGDANFICEETFLDPYKWMMNQMSKRLPDYKNERPIWLWLDSSNFCFDEFLDDNNYVILEIELDKSEVLLSNFQAWHIVLMDAHMNDEDLLVTKEESWEYIFDEEKMQELDFDFDDSDLQGVIGKIDLKNIKPLKYIVNNM